MNEEQRERVKKIKEDIEWIRNFNVDSIAQKERLGERNFEEVVPVVEQIIIVYKSVPLDLLDQVSFLTNSHCRFPIPSGTENIEDCVSNVIKVIQGILNYSFHENKEELIVNLERRYIHSLLVFSPLFCLRYLDKDDSQKMLDEIKDKRDEMDKIISATQDKIDQIISAAKDAALDSAVPRQAEFFKTEAEEQEKLSRRWLTATGVSAVPLIGVIGWFIFAGIDNGMQGIDAISAIATKALLVAVLGYVSLFCARNYMVRRHNVTVNRHRQNALSTYRALVEANAHPENADIVLTEAARFIFAPQDSGFVQNKGSGGDISVIPAMVREARKTAEPDK